MKNKGAYYPDELKGIALENKEYLEIIRAMESVASNKHVVNSFRRLLRDTEDARLKMSLDDWSSFGVFVDQLVAGELDYSLLQGRNFGKGSVIELKRIVTQVVQPNPSSQLIGVGYHRASGIGSDVVYEVRAIVDNDHAVVRTWLERKQRYEYSVVPVEILLDMFGSGTYIKRE